VYHQATEETMKLNLHKTGFDMSYQVISRVSRASAEIVIKQTDYYDYALDWFNKTIKEDPFLVKIIKTHPANQSVSHTISFSTLKVHRRHTKEMMIHISELMDLI